MCLKKTKVLSVDGGGDRGVIAACMLAQLEHETGRTVSELFDYFIGSSIGSYIINLLNLKGEDGRAKYRAEDLCQQWFEMRTKGSHALLLSGQKCTNMEIANEYYSTLGFYFQDYSVFDTIKPTLTVAQSLGANSSYVFSGISAKFPYFLRDVVMASGSIPGVSGVKEIQADYYIDGGWDRSYVGMEYLLDILPEQDDDIILVSIGTGNRGSSCKIPAISGLDKELLSGNICAEKLYPNSKGVGSFIESLNISWDPGAVDCCSIIKSLSMGLECYRFQPEIPCETKFVAQAESDLDILRDIARDYFVASNLRQFFEGYDDL